MAAVAFARRAHALFNAADLAPIDAIHVAIFAVNIVNVFKLQIFSFERQTSRINCLGKIDLAASNERKR